MVQYARLEAHIRCSVPLRIYDKRVAIPCHPQPCYVARLPTELAALLYPQIFVRLDLLQQLVIEQAGTTVGQGTDTNGWIQQFRLAISDNWSRAEAEATCGQELLLELLVEDSEHGQVHQSN